MRASSAAVMLVAIAACAVVVSAGASNFDFLKGVKGPNGQVSQQQPPIRAGGICRDRFVPWECPVYEYIPDFGLEFRYYPGPITFVMSTAYAPPGNLLAGFEATGRFVEQYFNGSNAAGKRFFPQVPFQVAVEGMNIVSWYYSTLFIVPQNETAPAPTSPFVRLIQVPAGQGFVMVVQNFAPTPLMEDGNQNAERVIFGAAHGLWEITAAIRLAIYEDLFIFNDYQPAFIHQNRRHENWFEVVQSSSNATASLRSIIRQGRTEANVFAL